MLSDPGPRFLLPAIAESTAQYERAAIAAATLDTLTARDTATALEVAAQAERSGLKVKATDLALRLIVDKLENRIGGLDDLLRVVGTLDPDTQKGGNNVVAVQVVIREERGEL